MKNQTKHRLNLVSIILSVSALLTAPVAFASSVTDNFNSGVDPNKYDVLTDPLTGVWTIDTDGPTVRISKQTSSSPDAQWRGGRIVSKYTLQGDFTVTVEFKLNNFPYANSRALNDSILYVQMEGAGSGPSRFDVLRFATASNQGMEAWAAPAGQVGFQAGGWIPSTLTSGRYRIERKGTTLTGSYSASLSGQQFVVLGSHMHSSYTGLAKIGLYGAQGLNASTSASLYTALDIEFDNLDLKADAIDGFEPDLHCVPPPADLVSWWPADGNANDVVDGNHGTLANGTTFAQGVVGQAFSFDGVDDYIQPGLPGALQFSGTDFTIAGWFKVPDYPNNAGPGCSSQYPIIGSAWGYAVGIGGDGRLWFGKYFTVSESVSVVTPGLIPVNTFHYFAAVHTATELRLYLDGTLANTVSSPTGNIYYQGPTPWIGRRECGGKSYFFKGQIDELAVFNRALSGTEIQAIFNAGSAGMCKPQGDCEQALAAAQQRIIALNDQVGTLSGQVTQLQGQLADANSRIKNLEGDNLVLTTENGLLKQKNNELTAENDSLRKQVTTLTDENKRLSDQIVELKKTIEGLNFQIFLLNEQIITLKAQNEQLNAQVKALTDENLQLKEQIKLLITENTLLKDQVKALTAERDQLRQQVQDLTSQLNQLKTTLATGLASVQNTLRTLFNDPAFVIPGATPEEQYQNLIAAIANLSKGRAEGLYVNLGGKPGKGSP